VSICVHSHTHSGGAVNSLSCFGGNKEDTPADVYDLAINKSTQADPDYRKMVIRQLASAIIMADKNSEEALINFGSGAENRYVFNRRFRMKDGTTCTHPGAHNPEIDCPAGPVDPEVGQHVYAWIRDGKKVYRGIEAGERMIAKQFEAIRLLKEHDIVVKVNSILIPGVNDHHIVDIAKYCKTMGVDLHNVIPLCPVEGTPFEDLEEPSAELVNELRKECGDLVPQMTHCQRCRADACGLLCEGTTQDTMDLLQQSSNAPINPDEDRPYVAVATREGVLVNLHLGEAEEFQIFSQADGEFVLVDTRKAPPGGCGDTRWVTLARWLSDCRAVLVSSAGPKPTDALTKEGIKVVVMEGLIDEALSAIYSGQEIKAPVREFKCGAGAGCTGDGGGCG